MTPVDKEIKDLTGDGQVSEQEFLLQKSIIEEDQENENQKLLAQQGIAFSSLAALIIFMIVMMTPLVTIERISAIEPIFQMMIFSLSSLVGVFMGIQGFQQLRKK